ncbi:hypothetical protein ABZ464_40710 [Streptomyces sp. NPDC005820]|uniref:hypothetical protein n=1 Tax=Streptomyces sp. NPDC005820 TaxID=3157069 RepID=UPI0033D0F2CF
MFRQLAALHADADSALPHGAADHVLELHPADLIDYLERAWEVMAPNQAGSPRTGWRPRRPDRHRLDDELAGLGMDHLVYAYMMESTLILEIFRRVLGAFLHTDRFNAPTPATVRWLEATEALFFRTQSPYAPHDATGSLRPDADAVRRNAYHRLLGLDLRHARDGRPGAHPYVRSPSANLGFVQHFQELLGKVWDGIENARNTSGPNATDNFGIQDLVSQISDALRERRGAGSALGVTPFLLPAGPVLAREEFGAVTLLSWFHLTISADTPVVKDLRATASTTSERLRKIGLSVGLLPHQHSRSFVELADLLSFLLRALESGNFPGPGNAGAFYLAAPTGIGTGSGNPLRDDMEAIIHHWSIVTGTDIRARSVRMTPAVGSASDRRSPWGSAGQAGSGLRPAVQPVR